MHVCVCIYIYMSLGKIGAKWNHTCQWNAQVLDVSYTVSICMYVYVCIHNPIGKGGCWFNLDTYIPTCIHAYIPTYIYTYMPTYMHTCIQIYIHTFTVRNITAGGWPPWVAPLRKTRHHINYLPQTMEWGMNSIYIYIYIYIYIFVFVCVFIFIYIYIYIYIYI
jgi:hypothetical protein